MKFVDKRKEVITTEYLTIEFTKQHLLTIVSALGLTTEVERLSELSSFYNVEDEDYQDKGEEALDFLTELLSLEERFEPESDPTLQKIEEVVENARSFASGYKGF
jgi:hypothetical protein